MLHPQGKNCSGTEFNALGDMLAGMAWEMPAAEEYKNDLVQPDFLDIPGVPKSSTCAVAIAEKKPDPNGPASPEQWKKVDKMVA